jgi:hypothetical protein
MEPDAFFGHMAFLLVPVAARSKAAERFFFCVGSCGSRRIAISTIFFDIITHKTSQKRNTKQ